MTPEEEQRLEPAGDRLREAHFLLHQLEACYHQADPFRWHLNAFLKALKEIPDLIAMALQNRAGFADWFRVRRSVVSGDPLISLLSSKRDFVVHRGMLLPHSKGSIGLTEGRGMKLGLGLPIDALTDSDDAMRRYLSKDDFLGIISIDDEDSMPCIQRRWSLHEFGDADLVDLCADAWLKIATLVQAVVTELSGPDLVINLECRHNLDGVRIRVYDRADLRQGNVSGRRF